MEQSWSKVGSKIPKVGAKLAQSWPKVGPKFVWICPPPQWQSSNSLVLEQGQTLWLWICQISRGYCHQKEWIVTLLSTRIGCKTCQWVLPGNYLIQIFNYVLNYKWYIFCYQNFSDLLWEKIVLVTEKNFWDHQNNLFKQSKVRMFFGNIMLF